MEVNVESKSLETTPEQKAESEPTAINETLVVGESEIKTESVVVEEETVTTTTIEALIVSDTVVYQVSSNNSQEIQQFVSSECDADGVTYVTVASSNSQETTSVTTTPTPKHVDKLENSSIGNLTQDSGIVSETTTESCTQSYEKFVQDAIEGEMDDLEPPEDEVEANRNDPEGIDDLEAKLHELTEGVKQETDPVTVLEGNDKDVNKDSVEGKVEGEMVEEDKSVEDQSDVVEQIEHVTADSVDKSDPKGDDPNVTQIDTDTNSLSEEPEVVESSPDNIEKQLSKIVHDEDSQPHGLSIAEEISRDFDDSDPEELSVSHEPHQAVIEEVVNIAKQHGHGPVAVTDNTGQVYYVETVEIVVENDSKDRDDDMEGTELGGGIEEDEEEVVEEETPSLPPIPSHLLGRNINNPIEDTFRNGKTPPKPRLGVKIPYKNLTSQIVSKDEIAKEVLQRSKAKMMQLRSNRENYFAKQITRRLVKKLVPPIEDEVKPKPSPINNSDLIAILEGNSDEKLTPTVVKPQKGQSKTEENQVFIDKDLERELALKQLSELPKRGRRKKESNYEVIENVTIPPRVRKSDVKNEIAKKMKIEEDIFETPKELDEQDKAELKKPIEEEVQKTIIEKPTSLPVLPQNSEKTGDPPKPSTANPPKSIINNTLAQKIIEASKKIKPKTHDSPKPGTSSESPEKKPANLPVKTYERKRKSTEENLISIPDKKQSVTIPPNSYVTKSSRIIKKKIIWDPDDPTSVKPAADKLSPQKPAKVVVKDVSKVDDQEDKPPVLKPEKPIQKAPEAEVVDKPIPKLEKIEPKPGPSFAKPDPIESKGKSPETTSSIKTKKRLTEVDKLLMDEGAVNMLYSVKNEDTKKFTGTTISLEKIQKELRNKTNEIKKDLTNNSDKISPKSLRKKDSPVVTPTKKPLPASVTRKKSKDSNRSSIHSPPASPSAMIYSNDYASRIIRRHSSSSYSSTDELTEEQKNEKKPAKKKMKKENNEQEKAEKQKINDENFSKLIEDAPGTSTSKTEEPSTGFDFNPSKYQEYKAIRVGKLENLIQISLLCQEGTEKAYLTYDVLIELTKLLKELQDDDGCKVVVLNSIAPSFCHGINYKDLYIKDEVKRKKIAQKLAKAVTDFLKTLAEFPKIITAGVQGECVGLAVTMLPLFDMVLASDTASFSVPNAKLGCAAEGGSLLSLPHLMHNALVSEMLYASRKFVAAEVLRFGMVTRVIWPDKFESELISAVKEISTHSLQFKQITKRQLRNRMKDQIREALSGEEELLLETWCSAECQRNFENYN